MHDNRTEKERAEGVGAPPLYIGRRNVKLTPVPGATSRYDEDGHEVIDVMTCGHCGRSWNDAAVSSMTPVPAGRCPFEYEHEYVEDASSIEADPMSAQRRGL